MRPLVPRAAGLQSLAAQQDPGRPKRPVGARAVDQPTAFSSWQARCDGVSSWTARRRQFPLQRLVEAVGAPRQAGPGRPLRNLSRDRLPAALRSAGALPFGFARRGLPARTDRGDQWRAIGLRSPGTAPDRPRRRGVDRGTRILRRASGFRISGCEADVAQSRRPGLGFHASVDAPACDLRDALLPSSARRHHVRWSSGSR